ncbi:MAG: M48 family metalloprotease [Dehalococcoidia bacterium]|nr:M48 family metalloprotease [Dehalococcoidia bacterium]
MRRRFATTSIESTLRSKFQGFAFNTTRWVFLSTLASVFLFAVTDILSLKIIFGLALAVTSGFVVVPLTECVVSFPEKLREIITISGARRTYSFALVEELSNLAKVMGVRLKGEDILKMVPQWLNAGATIDGKIILGQAVADEFDRETRKGILARELAHLKAKHSMKNAIVLFLTLIPVLLLISFLHLPGLVNLLLVFSAYGLILPMVSWRFEYEADAIAATFVGINPVIKGLRKLAEAKCADVRRDTYSHPSISNRISRLQKIGS